MASPKGAKGLPETDYVELYNTTDHTISLKGWSFIYDGTVIRLPDVPLAANRYAVLYRKGKSLPLNKKVLGLGFSNFPLNMSDEGKQLTLKDSSGTVIHSYTYPKAKAGRSIERGEGDKWHLSSDPRGGTPGEENSVAPSVPTPKPDDPATSPDTPSAPPSSPSDTVKSGDIVINEVMASPKGAKGLPETDYVELYNTTDHTISLKGWSFIYDGTVIRLPDVPLAANHYAVLYRKGKSLPLDKKVLGLGFSNFPLNMSDEGKRLTLKDSSGTVIHSYTYPKAKAGRSIERGEGDKWHLSTDPRGGTPGEENSEGAPDKPEREKSSPGDVLINEVMADPHGLTKLPATEYVELHNTTDHEINLEGWAFVYDKTSIPLPDAELSAGGYAVLYKAGREISVADGAAEVAVKRFPANMINAGKPLALKDPSGTVIHSYTYPKAKAGRSIERGEGDKWHLSTNPRGGTPGEENSEGAPDKPDKPEKEKSSPGDVLINEVMADSRGLTKLPATEYVELHNTTEHEINLEGWAFVYDKTSIPLPDAELPAGGYAVLYKAGREISVADGAAEVAVKRFPANMVNAGKPLTLKDPSGTVIYSYAYPKAKAGRSIERGEGDKWHLSSDPRGGTPGEENSEGAPDKPDEPEKEKSSPGDVLINEVMADPRGLTKLPATEYVELHNTTDHEINLEGWAFVYDKTSIPLPDAELPAGGYAVLYKAGREISVADGAAEVAVKRFPANMINAGKPLALKDPSGTVIHSYTYPKAKAGRSIERGEGDKWHLSSDPRGGTPGEENSESTPDEPEKPKASPGDVLINEVMADPHGLTKLPATEYVELHNTTDHEIDLEGWAFVYDKTSIPLPDAELPAGGYAVLYKAGREISVADGAAEVAVKRFPANMINAGKPLALKDPSGTVIHSYTYPKAKAGRSIERGEGYKWHLSSDPRGGTPGEENSEGTPDRPDESEKPKASPGDVLINEVMADPRGLTKLPATEYVELHNTTDHEINLEGWTFVYDKTSIPLPDTELSAGGYAVLYKAGREISVADGAAEVAVKRFPANMINAGKPLALKDPSGTVIHSYTYPKAKAGRSIERGEGDKWHLSTNPRGGTPGEENSEGAPDKPDEPEKEKSSPGDVLINEVMADPRGLTKLPTTEYVELHNTTDHEIDLEGWAFVYDKTSIPLPDAELPAGGYAVLYKAGREISIADGAAEVAVKRFPVNMVNAGKPLALKDPSGTMIHSYAYPKAKAGRSIERGEGDKWHLSTDPRGGTPGEENSEGALDKPDEPKVFSPGDVLINEVMADPRGLTKLPATEYVELHNTTDHEINLEGWTFVYDKTSIPLPDAELPAGGYAVLYKAGREISVGEGAAEVVVKRFPANMVNAGKPLALKDPSGTVIHSYTYPKAKAGRSIERGEGDTWHLSSDPRGGTPGEENSEGAPDKPDEPNKPNEPNATEQVEPREIVLNEILFDPQPRGSEYIELYNRSDRTLSTHGLAIALRKSDGHLGTRHSLTSLATTLAPGDYLVLTSDPNGVTSLIRTPALDVIRRFKLPALNNQGATIVLLRTADSTVVDEVTYSAKWHSSAVKIRRGVALERISPDGSSQEAANWTSASSETGYGTPGYKNSQSGTSSQIEEGATISEPEYNASTRDYLIRYRMDKPDYRCQMAVYSSNGQKVAVIANNQLLTPEGEIRWDGAGLTPGVYIFYVELYHPDGSSQHIRKPLLVH
ncbi:hypothetical protein T229_06460 [Tannerella sp. oral taxon BU063 isolate Cell 5]|uniref:LTD domain-containing protein n=1 Tax=Tannerella sp. oral taxon BU063 isolate Cell 5 TaxID=1410950 RepID=W2CEI4_9BACT|nr:hypothetical protein T229_06460 [Tannerella sp. oral taxon BU063 isolate Cell 5]